MISPSMRSIEIECECEHSTFLIDDSNVKVPGSLQNPVERKFRGTIGEMSTFSLFSISIRKDN